MSVSPRGGLEILRELLELTKEMVRQRGDAEFLVRSVDRRQALMDEYDALQASENTPLPPDALAEAKRIAQEITGMDGIINSSLDGYHNEAKAQLASNTHHQRVMGYINQAASSSSGSYMDFKK